MLTVHKYNLEDFLSRSTDVESEALVALSNLPKLGENGPWVAGGLLRRAIIRESIKYSDIDVFFNNEKQLSDFICKLKNLSFKEGLKNEFNQVFLKDNLKVQLIHFRYYDSVDILLDSFDFTICQFATDGNNLFSGEYSLWDLSKKRLALHKLTFGVATVRRLIKYTNQGFVACGGVLADILERTVNDPDTIKRDVEYID